MKNIMDTGYQIKTLPCPTLPAPRPRATTTTTRHKGYDTSYCWLANNKLAQEDVIEIDNPTHNPTHAEENIHRAPKCQVCLDVLVGPHTQCNTGHAICFPCKVRTPTCPQCKQPYPPSRRTILDVVPKKCCYCVSGCPVIMSPDGDHELYCVYRATQCFICEWSGKVKDLGSHALKNHPGAVFNLNRFYNSNSIDLSFVDFRSLKLAYCLVIIYDQLFWVCFKEDVTTKQILAQSIWIPNAKPTSMIFIVLKLKNKIADIKHVMKCSSDDLAIRNDVNAYKSSLPCSIVFGLGQESTTLKVNVTFVKEDRKRLDIWLIFRILLIIFLVFLFLKKIKFFK